MVYINGALHSPIDRLSTGPTYFELHIQPGGSREETFLRLHHPEHSGEDTTRNVQRVQ